MLRQSDPANSIKPRDIHNLQARLRTEFLDGRTPIQALLYQIPEEGDWIMNYQATDNVVTAVFTSIEGKGESNVGALDVGRLRGNYARYGGSLEEIPS